MDVSKHIGAFMDNHAQVQKAVEAQKNEVPKKGGTSRSSQALNNVMMARELQAASDEIKQYLIYQTPGLGAIWTDYQAEMARLAKLERDEEIRIAKEEELARKKAADRIRRIKERAHIYISVVVAITVIVLYLWALTQLVLWDRQDRWGF